MDTIAALSSGRPPAGIAVIRTSGPQAHEVAVAIAGALPRPRQAALRTFHHPYTGLPLDSGIVLRFDAPNSATGEDIVEYQCHGGRAVVAAMLDALTSFPGLRMAEPGEFTRRALVHGRLDLTEAEGLADLLEAETEAQRRAALALAGGALTRQIGDWQQRLLNLSARAEAAIDYVGDEDETATDTKSLRADTARLVDEIDAWLARPRAERLKDGIRVVVAGPPNAGKSSLINALAGSERAIVTAIPGTTRDAIEVPLVLGGVAFLFVDTAGLRETTDPVEAIGVSRARAELERADLIVWLGDRSNSATAPNLIAVNSQCDIRRVANGNLDVSSLTLEGIDRLVSQLIDRSSNLLPADGEVSLNQRQALIVHELADTLRVAPDDLLLLAETLRFARSKLDRLTGRAGVEEALDALFGRFCLGK